MGLSSSPETIARSAIRSHFFTTLGWLRRFTPTCVGTVEVFGDAVHHVPVHPHVRGPAPYGIPSQAMSRAGEATPQNPIRWKTLMVVMILECVPASLRGELMRWLLDFGDFRVAGRAAIFFCVCGAAARPEPRPPVRPPPHSIQSLFVPFVVKAIF